VTSGSALTQGDDAFVVFLEQTVTGVEHSKNVEYVSDFDTVAIARKKG
jgi:hypothetical protein